MKNRRYPIHRVVCWAELLFLALAGAEALFSQQISGFDPPVGAPGEPVTISGSGFSPGTLVVKFHGTQDTTAQATSASTIVAHVPNGATGGPISVQVNGTVASSSGNFLVVGLGPYITGFAPAFGGPTDLTPILISGYHLSNNVVVKFNGTLSPNPQPNAAGTLISAFVPVGAASGFISVTTSRGTSNSPTAFTVIGPDPYITGFTPAQGSAGTNVLITGAHFMSAAATSASFDGKTGSHFLVHSDTEIQVDAPAGVTTGPITVNSSKGAYTTATNFFVPPLITTFAPVNGRTGTNVSLNGSNLRGVTQVTFGGVAAAFGPTTNNTLLQATVPAGAISGKIAVIAPAGSSSSAANFNLPPTIFGFAPASGPVGTSVTITGANLNEGLPGVKLNNVPASLNSAAAFGQVTVTVPAGASTGPFSVTTTNGTYVSPTNFFLPPSISSFSPTNSAPGTTVTITGQNLLGASAVDFAGVPAGFTPPTNNTLLFAKVPVGVVTGPIRIATPAATITSTALFYALPLITRFTPTQGIAGASVAIAGTNFLGATAVKFGGINALVFNVVDGNNLQATAPAKAPSGPVTVTGPAGTGSSLGNFAFEPTISGFTPSFGPAGTSVTISGANLNEGLSAVKFNNVAATLTLVPGFGQVTVTVPGGASTGPLSVTTTNGTFVSPTNFFLPASISSFTPTNSAPGTTVTINGQNLWGTSAVSFGGVPAIFTLPTNNVLLLAKVPVGVVTGPIRITTPAGTLNSAASFYAAPQINGFAPTQGLAGASVTITGTNFLGVTAVKFNGSSASTFNVLAGGTIQATAPAATATGPITVTGPAGTASSLANFAFQPTIFGFAPAFGPVESSVIITGANLNEGLAVVKFNGAVATQTSPPGFGQLTATVPPLAATGPISVTTSNGTVVTLTNFFLPATLSGFTPTNSAPGTTVTLTGQNLLGTFTVAFGGLPASFTAPSNNLVLFAKVPVGVNTGPVSVSTPAGSYLSSGLFYGPPAITSFTPNHGLPGAAVTITGTNFQGTTAVKFGGTSAALFSVVNAGLIQVIVPSNAVTGPIAVTAPAGTATTGSNYVVDAMSELSLSISGLPDPVFVGSNLTYRIMVANHGPIAATNVLLNDILPASVDQLSNTTTSGIITVNGNHLTGFLGTLATNRTINVTLTVIPRAIGSITNIASVSSDNADLSVGNNTNTLAVTVLPLPLLSLQPYPANMHQWLISWPSMLTNYQLQFRNGLASLDAWSNIATGPSVAGTNRFVIEPNSGSAKFYRLKN